MDESFWGGGEMFPFQNTNLIQSNEVIKFLLQLFLMISCNGELPFS